MLALEVLTEGENHLEGPASADPKSQEHARTAPG
jgi:hypothetical protein